MSCAWKPSRFSTQISRFEEWSDFNFARPRHGIWAALYPGNRLVHILDFPEPETGDQFPCLGKRPVDERATGTIERNTLSVRRRLEAVGSEQDAGIAQLIVESTHRLKHLGCPGRWEKALFAVFGRFHEHYYTHFLSPC